MNTSREASTAIAVVGVFVIACYKLFWGGVISANGLHLRRFPVWRSQIGALFAFLSFANNVTKEAVPEGPKERSD